MTEDRKSQYIVQIGNESQMWDADKLTKNSERLASSHPEAQVYQLDDYDLSETPSSEYSYIVNIGGETQQWDAVKLDKNKDKLFARYPDAKVQKVSAWKNPYLKSESQVAKENLDAFREENGAFLDGFEARDTAERKMATANAMKGIFVTGEGGISGEERGRYIELSKQEEDLKKAYYNSPDVVNARLQRGESISTMQKEIDKALFALENNSPDAFREMKQASIKRANPRTALMAAKPLSVDAQEIQADYSNYKTAQSLLDDAIKINNAPSRYDSSNGFVNFMKGMGKTFSDVDFWSAGLTEIAENMKLRGVLSTVQEKLGNLNELSEEAVDAVLTDSEKKVLAAFVINTDAQYDRAEDLSRALQAGQSAAESLGFMAEFILTGGIAKGATQIAESAANKVLRGYLGKLAGKVSKTAVGKYATRFAGDAIGAAARTLVLPSTYRNMSQQAIQIKEDPETGERKLASVSESVARGFADSFIEALAEGGRVGAIGDFFGDVLGSIKPAKKFMDKVKKSDIAQLFKTINNTEVLSVLRAGGWHGIGEEYLEEWYGAALRTLTNLDPEALKDFATVDNQLITLTSFLPMTLIGGSVSTGQVLHSKKDLEKKAAVLKSAMIDRGYTEAQANLLVDNMRTAPMQNISDTFTPMVNKMAQQENGNAPELMKAVSDFAMASARMQSYGIAYDEQEAWQRNWLLYDMEEQIGRFWQEDAEGNRTVELATTEDGTPVYILGGEKYEEVTEDGVIMPMNPEYMAVDMQGNVRFVNNVTDSQTMSIDDYLNTRLIERRGAEEEARIAQETEQYQNDIKSQIVLNQTVLNMGTQENPISGLVVGLSEEGVTVQTGEGVFSLTWNEVGNKLAMPNPVQTNAQIDEAEAANLDAQQNAREAMLDEQFDNPLAAEEEVAEGEAAEAAVEDVTYNYPLKKDGSVDGNALWNENVREWIKWNNQRIAEKYGIADNGADSINYLQNQIASLERSAKKIASNKNKETDFDKKIQLEDNEIAVNKRLAELREILAEMTGETAVEVVTETVAEETPAEPAPEVSESTESEEDTDRLTSEIVSLMDGTLTDSEIDDYINNNIKKAQKELTAHNKKTPKIGTDKQQYLEEKKKHQAKVEQIQSEIDFWNEVKSTLETIRGTYIPAQGEIVNKDYDLTPFTPAELVADFFGSISSNAPKIRKDSFLGHTGYSESDAKALGFFLRKNSGITMEEMAERIESYDQEQGYNILDHSDPMAGMNALLEAFSEIKSHWEMFSMIKNNRRVQAESEAKAAYDAMLYEIEQAEHMTIDEFETYKEVIARDIVNGALTDAQINELNSIFAEDYYAYENNEINSGRKDTNVEPNVTRRDNGIREDRNPLLQGEQLDNSGDGRRAEERSSENSRSGNQQDGNAPSGVGVDSSEGRTAEGVNGYGEGTEIVEPDNDGERKADSAGVAGDIGDIPDDIWESSLDEDMPDFTNSASAYFPTDEIRQRFAVLKTRINDWSSKLGVKVRIMETLDDVVNQSARQQILNGVKVFGFFDTTSGEVAIYLPDFLPFSETDALSEIDKTYIHEVVSHRGLRGLLGEEKYGELCDMVWEAMTDAQKQSYRNYPGVNGNARAAADEFIAHFAENVDYTDNKTMWDKIVDFIKSLFNSDEFPVEISNESMAELLRRSYNKLASVASERVSPEKISLEDYLGRLGLSSPISDYMDDKLRNPHGLSESQRKQLERNAANASEDYHSRRSNAIKEYARLVSEGKIVPTTQIDKLFTTANGHPDNAATQAARRSLEKRGYDWQTGEKKPSDVKSEPKVEKAEKKTTSSKSTVGTKIEDFGEKIGGARKDAARSRIRDAAKLSRTDLNKLNDPDKILSRKQIIKYVSEGQMTVEDGQMLLAANMAVRGESYIQKDVALTKYRDLAVAWEKGEDLMFEINDQDVETIYETYSQKIKDSVPELRDRIRKSFTITLMNNYHGYLATYKELNYPVENRDLKGTYVRYGLHDSKYWVVSGPNARRGWPKASMAEAVNYIKNNFPLIETSNKDGKKNKEGKETFGHLHVVKSRYGGYRIKSRNIPGDIYISGKDFVTKKLAEAYLKENAEKLMEIEARMSEALMGSNIGMVERQGKDYRNEKDVTPQDFMDTFGFRGVEFGNWVPQAERQMYLNKTYDAIMDFCEVVGISPKAFSLGGRLGLAFGARGKSSALAHYEPMKEVINLTRIKGAGSLAHEWFHALDNFLAKQKSGNTSDMATATRDTVREEVASAFDAFVRKMNSLAYTKRSRRAGEYWGEVWERAARLFENYVYNELGGKGTVSPLLVRKDVLFNEGEGNADVAMINGTESASWWPYPSARENEEMKPYFDALFDAIQEQVQEDGNVVLYRSKPEPDENVAGLETLVERTYRTSGAFSFSGKDQIESRDDVAFIFRQLEDSAVENSFLVFVKNGVPTILHVGMGDISSTFIDNSAVLPAYKDFGADKVYMVHNHPSGSLYASMQDVKGLAKIHNQLTGVPVEGIIIDTVSGEYAVFNDLGDISQRAMPNDEAAVEIEVLSFDRSVFASDYKSKINERKIQGPQDIAAFLSAHRLGQGTKVGALLLNRQNVINGNLVTNDNEVSMDNVDELASQIAEAANRTGSSSVILFGDFDYSDRALRSLSKTIKSISGETVNMLDVVRLEGNHTQSLVEETLPSRTTLNDGVRFRVSNENQAIFVSNAAKAVEGIKQEKATPEQWLKMLEKAGGLKAGEDKWMGLSDWLKASDKNTLTKQEVLDYINENMIVIEEVHYVEGAEEDFDELAEDTRYALQEIYDEYIAESEDMNDDMFMSTHYDYAIQKLAESLGYKAWNAPFVNMNATIRLDLDSDFAAQELNDIRERLGMPRNVKEENGINETRLGYTTRGLANNHEIALTVPSIDPWNKSDVIHFGDAGEGRAVAWIRFGETTDYKELSNDEREAIINSMPMPEMWTKHDGSQFVAKRDIYVLDETSRSKYGFIVDRGGKFVISGPIAKRMMTIQFDIFDEAVYAFYRAIAPKVKESKILVIDEIQSKRHQEGREKGYKSDVGLSSEQERLAKVLDAKYARRGELIRERENENENELTRLAQIDIELDEVKNVRDYDRLTNEADEIRARRENRDAEIESLRYEIRDLEREQDEFFRRKEYQYSIAVPDAPFEKNWHELAMKRMLRYAAENGYDAVAWTKGDQQAERYNIGGVLEAIQHYESEKGRVVIVKPRNNESSRFVVNNEGLIIESRGPLSGDATTLSDVVGKELASKIMSGEGEDIEKRDGATYYPAKMIKGEGIRIGGEGMKGFYDHILPKFMDKYGKKWGIKVADINLPHLEDGLTMHSVPVTEEMKASVMEGQVMFRVRGENESAEEFIQTEINRFQETYGTKTPMLIVDYSSKEAAARSLRMNPEDLLDENYQLIVEAAEDSDACFISDIDTIAIFAKESVTTSGKADNIFFHENTHAFVKENPQLLELGQWLFENSQTGIKKSTAEIVRAKYPKSQHVEEMLTGYTGLMLSLGRSRAVLESLPEELKSTWEEIVTRFNYNSEYEDTRRKSDTKRDADGGRNAASVQMRNSSDAELENKGGISWKRQQRDTDVRFRSVEITPKVQDELDAIKASAIVMGNFMKAPNGKDTNLTEEQWLMVRTKNFKSWFGDWENDPENASKVVDENGEPMVVYHGTGADFTKFVASESDKGYYHWELAHFGTREQAEDVMRTSPGNKHIMEVFLNIRKPYRISDQEGGDEWRYAAKQAANGMFADQNGENADGLVYLNMYEGKTPADSYAVWNPSQIKSATDNTGEFSEGEGDIRFRAVPLDATPTEEVVAGGLDITDRQVVELAGNLFAAFPADIRKKITDRMNGNPLNLQNAIFAIPAELAEKESLNDEERSIASIITREVQSIIDTPMTRDLHISEALWMLYDRVFPTSSYDLVGAAKKAQIKDNLGFSERKLKEKQDDIRYRAATQAEIDAMERSMTAADIYNRDVTSAIMRLRESFQDMYRSAQKMVDAIVQKTGKAVKSFEDIMLALNQLSSKNLADKGNYLRNFLMPMWDAVLAFKEKGKTIDDVIRYVMLKHGLERNDVLAQRDARNYYKEAYDKKVRDIEADKSISDTEKQDKKDKAKDDYDFHVASIQAGTDAKYRELRERDYGAIMALYSDYVDIPDRMPGETIEQFNQRQRKARLPKYTDLAVAEAEAAREVEAFENANRALCDRLWKRINAATKETLKHQYEHNVISKQTYDHVRVMFEFYIPLRGFKEDTAEDIYSYYGKDVSTDFANPLIRTKGRTTLAESPFGWIGSMAESAIQMDNKNDAKMRLYYFAVNRPGQNLLTLQKTWYKNVGEDADGRSKWEASYPNITPDMDHDQTRQEIERHDAEMKALAASGQATQKKSELNLRNSVVNISDKAKPEHAITVLINGEEQVMYVNGNPRAAQAINGMLNIDKGDSGLYRILGQKITRWMSRMNTSYNPAFWISNYERDLLFTIMSINVKEDKAYRDLFWSNYVNPAKVTQLLRKYEKGELDMSNPVEKAYKEFADNGGITGFTVLANNEEYDKLLDKYSRDVERSKFIKGAQSALGLIQDFGEGAEQASRFAAYMTSRQVGRSIEASIGDAKEVTVNFNKKGSGKAISWKETGNLSYGTYIDSHPKLKWCARVMTMLVSSMAPAGRSVYMFFNASIQGLKAFVSLYKKNPGKAAMWSGAYFGMGFALAALNHMINAIAGGDDDDYLDIPDWERRNNIIIGGNGFYIKWALPQEARPFYAVADIILNKALGRSPDENLVEQVGRALLEVLPVNPLGEGGFAQAVVPSALSPLYEIWQNTDYKGMPLYRESYWSTGEEPKYDKAFSGTGKVFVEISRLLNEASGGDYAEAGAINIHPAAIEHLIEGYGGGTVTFFNQLMKTLTGNYGTGEWTIRNTPFLNRVITINDERYRNSHTSDVFKHYENLAKDTKRIYSVYKSNDDIDKLDELMDQKRYDIMKIYERYIKKEEKYDDLIRDAEDERERRELMAEQDEIRREMIKEISEL